MQLELKLIHREINTSFKKMSAIQNIHHTDARILEYNKKEKGSVNSACNSRSGRFTPLLSSFRRFFFIAWASGTTSTFAVMRASTATTACTFLFSISFTIRDIFS